MAVIAREHFTGTAGTFLEDLPGPFTAAGRLEWLPTNLSIKVARLTASNTLRPYNDYPNEGGFYLEQTVLPPQANNEVGITIKVLAPAALGGAGYLPVPPCLVARASGTPTPCYFAEFGMSFSGVYPYDTDGNFGLYAYDGFGTHLLGSYAYGAVAEGDLIRVALRCKGSTISLRVNDVVVISATDTRATLPGKWGIYVPNNGPWYGDAGPWSVDDWYLDDLVYCTDVLVRDVLKDVLEQAGLVDGQDFDVSAADEVVYGYALLQRQDAKGGLEPLLRAYASDMVEEDGKLVYVKRGGGPAAWLAASELGTVAWDRGASAEPTVVAKRAQDHELPTILEVNYLSPDRQFQQASQVVSRHSKFYQRQSLTVALPMAMSDATAKATAERLLYEAWVQRTQISVKTGIRWAFLSPADVIMVGVAGQDVRFRADSVEHEPFGLVSLALVADDQLTPVQPAAIIAGGTPPTIDPTQSWFPLVPGDDSPVHYVWNGTSLRNEDVPTDGTGLYYAAAGPPGWQGVAFWVSQDGLGRAYRHFDSVVDYAVIGSCLTVLPDGASTARWDMASTLDVQFYRGQPTSVGYWDVIDGANALLVGLEVVQFMTAVVIDASLNQYRLSGFLRGQRGSDGLWAGHAADETAVLLDGNVRRLWLAQHVVGHSIDVKVLPPMQSLGSVLAEAVPTPGYDQYPYSPVDLVGVKDVPSAGDWTLSWKRRTRSGGSWADYVDADLGEVSEAYVVDIRSSPTIVVRSTAVSAPTIVYTAAQQTADFGSPQASLARVYVYQVGRIGRGFVLIGSV